MKKIINGKLYDTDTAKEVFAISCGNGPSDFHYYAEQLYRKRTGEYFLYEPLCRVMRSEPVDRWRTN